MCRGYLCLLTQGEEGGALQVAEEIAGIWPRAVDFCYHSNVIYTSHRAISSGTAKTENHTFIRTNRLVRFKTGQVLLLMANGRADRDYAGGSLLGIFADARTPTEVLALLYPYWTICFCRLSI